MSSGGTGESFDVAVIGGGIVGLAHAWTAARRGLRVGLFERDAAAMGASVRNFGMIWPIGQPTGDKREIAMRAREGWRELDRLGVVEVQDCGSLHLAHHPDELAVLEEYSSMERNDVEMWTRTEVLDRAPQANEVGLLGGMYSPHEMRVDPRTASARIAAWLAQDHGVSVWYRTPIASVEGREVKASDGRVWRADRILVCGGSDFATLFPEAFTESGLVPCKLQMLKSVPQPVSHRQSIHLASGLTLRHYSSFEVCPSLTGLKERIARESPELDRYGIHVMVSPFPGGEVIMGDSHEYGDEITPFDKSEIDELMLRELRRAFHLADWTIAERWHGIYAKHPTLPVFESRVSDRATVFTGTGGAGMTMAFGLAENAWTRWDGS